MNRKFVNTLLSASFLGLVGVSATILGTASAQEKVGINAIIERPEAISIVDFDASAREVLEGGDAFLNDTIISGEGAKMQILLLDEKTITIGQNCEFVIDKFVYNPADNSGEMIASVAKGAFRFMSGKPSTRSRTTLRTPVASMGVRGTVVEGAVGPRAVEITRNSVTLPNDLMIDSQDASLIILRGPSDNAQGIDNEGAVDVLPADMTTTALEQQRYASIGSNSLMASQLPTYIAANMMAAQDRDTPPKEQQGSGLMVESGDKTVALTRPNTAVFIPYKGGPIIGPFALSDRSFSLFSDDLRTAPFGAAPFESPFELNVAEGSGDEVNDGDYGFPWIGEDRTLTERPDIDDNLFTFPPGPPICPPGTLNCP
jgi:FecR-like protein